MIFTYHLDIRNGDIDEWLFLTQRGHDPLVSWVGGLEKRSYGRIAARRNTNLLPFSICPLFDCNDYYLSPASFFGDKYNSRFHSYAYGHATIQSCSLVHHSLTFIRRTWKSYNFLYVSLTTIWEYWKTPVYERISSSNSNIPFIIPFPVRQWLEPTHCLPGHFPSVSLQKAFDERNGGKNKEKTGWHVMIIWPSSIPLFLPNFNPAKVCLIRVLANTTRFSFIL